MKVLHVVADGAAGGGPTNALLLVKHQLRDGLDVHYVTEPNSYGFREASRLGATTHALDFFRSRVDPTVPRGLRKVLALAQPDVIHAQGSRGAFFATFTGPVKRRPPLIYTVRGYHFSEKPGLLRRLAIAAERRIHTRAALTVFECEHDRKMAADLKLLPPALPFEIINNGIEFDDLPGTSSADPRAVGLLGRVTEQKDPFLALSIAEQLAPEGFRFTFIGGGALEQTLRSAIRERGLTDAVAVRGELRREDALSALADIGVLLVTSRWEGMPVAPIEAMVAGVPVVAASVGGLPEILGDESGVLVDDRDPASYAGALREIAGDPERRARLVAAGRARARERFSAKRTAEAYDRAYADVLERARHG